MTAPPHPLYEQSWPEGEYRFFQIGHVVHDIVAAAETWAATFGIGPFHVLPASDQRLTYRSGEERVVRIQVAVAQAGPAQIELIQQHGDAPSIFRDWSVGGTSAFHQLATVTSDYDAKVEHLERQGHEVVAESLEGKFRVAYVDTVGAFGFYTEVVERTQEFLDQVARISRTCADWDGTDPVRLLVRGGYRVPGADGDG